MQQRAARGRSSFIVRAVDGVVLQSSRAQQHCISAVVFLRAIARG